MKKTILSLFDPHQVQSLFLMAFVSLLINSGCRPDFAGRPPSWSQLELSDSEVAQIEYSFQEILLVDTEGNTYDADALSESITILNFWASWCPPCRLELPTLVELQKRYPSDQLLIIGINEDAEPADIINAIHDEFEINFPLVSQNGPVISRNFHSGSIPRSFIFYKGHLVEAYLGAINFTHSSIIRMIEELLAREEVFEDFGNNQQAINRSL